MSSEAEEARFALSLRAEALAEAEACMVLCEPAIPVSASRLLNADAAFPTEDIPPAPARSMLPASRAILPPFCPIQFAKALFDHDPMAPHLHTIPAEKHLLTPM